MTVKNSRRTTRRVYRIGLLISASWLVVTAYWSSAVVRALLGVRDAPTPLDVIAAFDRYRDAVTYGAVIACLLFVIRVVMFLQWPDARLLWRSWRR